MSKTKTLWFSIIILFALTVSLVLHAYLGSFSRFLGDDYCSAFQANRLGVFRATWYWYLTWSGRYSASALDSIFGILGPGITPFVTPVVIGSWLLMLGITFRKIFSAGIDKALNAILFATSTLFLTLNFTPHIQQSLYWGQGMRAVVPPLILSTTYAGIFSVIKNLDTQRRKTYLVWCFFSFIFAFGTGGFSETFSALQLAAFGVSIFVLTIIYHYRYKSFASLFLVSGFFGALLSFLVILAAPGNQFRQAFFPAHPNLFGILEISFRGFFGYVKEMFSTLESILGFLGVFLLNAIVGYTAKDKQTPKFNYPLILMSALSLIFACFPPAAYGMSDIPPGRTLILSTYILAMLVVFSGYFVGSRIAQTKKYLSQFLMQGSFLLIIAFLVTSSFIVSQKLYSSRHLYIEFAANWDNTHQTLLQLARSDKDIIAPSVKDNWSGVLKMEGNPRFYVNTCVSEYYGFNSIVAIDNLPPTVP